MVFRKSYNKEDKTWILETQVIYNPALAKSLVALSNSSMKNGVIHIIASSHQDIAWMDSPQKCIEDRDKILITPALRQLKEYPNYGFDMENILCLREYLERHPDRKDEIYKFTKEGRITWGGSYTAPYDPVIQPQGSRIEGRQVPLLCLLSLDP